MTCPWHPTPRLAVWADSSKVHLRVAALSVQGPPCGGHAVGVGGWCPAARRCPLGSSPPNADPTAALSQRWPPRLRGRQSPTGRSAGHPDLVRAARSAALGGDMGLSQSLGSMASNPSVNPQSLLSPSSVCPCQSVGTWGTTGGKHGGQSATAREPCSCRLPGTDANPRLRGRAGGGVWSRDPTRGRAVGIGAGSPVQWPRPSPQNRTPEGASWPGGREPSAGRGGGRRQRGGEGRGGAGSAQPLRREMEARVSSPLF